MYLISAYFDGQSNTILQRYINLVAERTGNDFMLENHVPPHMTISSIEARSIDLLKDGFANLEGKLSKGKIFIASPGMLLPYVLYVSPVMNEYLLSLSKDIYDSVPVSDEITVSRFYRPYSWLPHITIGKKLDKEQMTIALEVIRENFVPFEAEIQEIGLAKTNPHEDVMRIEL